MARQELPDVLRSGPPSRLPSSTTSAGQKYAGGDQRRRAAGQGLG